MKNLLRSKAFHQTLGIVVSVVLIGWMIAALDWHEVLAAMRTIKYWPILPTLLLIGVHWYLRAIRWHYLLPRSESRVPMRVLFDSFMAGNFATFVLPLRAGEFVRPFLLSRQSSYPFPTAFASIVIERFFDLVSVLLSFAIMLAYVPNVPSLVTKGALLLGALAVVILIVMITGVYFPNKITALARWGTARFPEALHQKILKIVEDLLHGLTILKDPRTLGLVTVLSVCVWLSCYTFFWAFLYFFDLPTSLWAGVAVAVVIALAVAAPSAPGFIGVYEGGCIVGLGLFGVSKELAVAYALVSHAYQYILIVGYGFYLLTRYNLKLKDLETSNR